MAKLMSESQIEVTASMGHSAQMHREVLEDYVRDFGRAKVRPSTHATVRYDFIDWL
jgi:hypothetical protein